MPNQTAAGRPISNCNSFDVGTCGLGKKAGALKPFSQLGGCKRMLDVTEADAVRVVGPTDELVLREIQRAGATISDLRAAVAFVSCEAGGSARAYAALAPRMRRLVDLVAVVADDGREAAGPAERAAGARVSGVPRSGTLRADTLI